MMSVPKLVKSPPEQAVQELGIEASVEKIEDINVITGFGVMMTPAIAIGTVAIVAGVIVSVPRSVDVGVLRRGRGREKRAGESVDPELHREAPCRGGVRWRPGACGIPRPRDP